MNVISPIVTLLMFGGMILLCILIGVLFIHFSKKKEWEKALRDDKDLGQHSAERMKYLEERNDSLVRENAEWKTRADQLSMYLADRERKLADARVEIGATTERAVKAEKERDEAIERMTFLRKEMDELRREAALSRPVSVERPYEYRDQRVHPQSGSRIGRPSGVMAPVSSGELSSNKEENQPRKPGPRKG